MSSYMDLARGTVMVHEGCELFPYKDSLGVMTIGFGRNLDANGISKEEAVQLLENDLRDTVLSLERFCWWQHLNEVRKAAMIDMHFNLGSTRFRKFRGMLSALERGDYTAAASEMLDSLWAVQVKGRAITLSNMMRSGEV